MGVVFAIIAPNFATGGNILNVLRQSSPLFMLACGQTLIILLAGIDLSQGSVVALVSMVTASFLINFGLAAGILIGFVAGAGCGLIQGLLVAKAKMQPIVVSLGMLFSIWGLTYMITEGNPIYWLPESFAIIGGGMVGIIPVPVILFAVVAAIFHQLLVRTSLGRNIYAVGGNEGAALLSGVEVDRVKILGWVVNGFLVALGSIILTSRGGAGHPLLGGFPLLLESIAAVVIGGTSLFGGKGSMLGTLIGVLFVSFLINGLMLLGLNQYIREATLGALIIIAVWAGFRGR
jgi:ribose/xylose/arabinose/galactoside ABC-type transport system permease subunit